MTSSRVAPGDLFAQVSAGDQLDRPQMQLDVAGLIRPFD